MNQIHLFTGENNFALTEKKRLWLNEFISKHGAENISKLYAREITFNALLDEVSTAPFIAQKRLILLYGIPRCTNEDMSRLQQCIHPDVVLLFIEPKIDKRLSAAKAVLHIAQIEEFLPVRGSKLMQWMECYTSSIGASFGPNAMQAMINIVGENQDFLSREMQKLAIYTNGRSIEKEDVEEMVLFAGEQQIWGLMDLLGQKKQKEALAYIHTLMQQGESAHGIWSILLWMMSSLIAVASAVEDGMTNPGAIVKQCGVSFGSAKSLLPIAKQCDKKELCALLDRIVAYDMSLKTGKYKTTDHEPQELLALLDRTVLACCA